METTRRFDRTLASASILGAVLAASLAACGGGSGGGAGNDTLHDIYVDAASGSDATGNGSEGHPYKTITGGLQNARPGDVVRVGPGTYDAANGEEFPIQPGLGVTIVGTEDQGEFGILRLTNVVGGGLWSGDPAGRLHAAIVPNVDNHLVALRITNPQPLVVGGAIPGAVVIAVSGVTVESCTLHSTHNGVHMVGGATDTLIKGCTSASNTYGIFVDVGGDGNRVEECMVIDNGSGVMNFSSGVDFGGGASGSLGANVFAGNSNWDMVYNGTGADPVFAANCFWDNAPPTLSTGSLVYSTDVWEMGSGVVVTTGAQVYQAGPVAPFPGGGVIGH